MLAFNIPDAIQCAVPAAVLIRTAVCYDFLQRRLIRQAANGLHGPGAPKLKPDPAGVQFHPQLVVALNMPCFYRPMFSVLKASACIYLQTFGTFEHAKTI